MTTDFDDLSDEQLEAALNSGMVPPSEPAVPEPPAPEAEPEPAPEPEAPPEPTPTPEAPKPEEAEPDEAKLLAQEMEARAKHWESVAGRNAGELGFIKAQLKAIQEAQARGSEPSQDDTDGEPLRPPAPPQQPSGLTQWAVQQAIQQTVAAFAGGHPDVTELQDQMAAYLKDSGYDFNQAMAMPDPIAAQRETARALEEAYWHTKAVVTATRRAELSAKREASQMKAASDKLKSSVSGTASTPPPKPKEKTVDEMSDSELEAAMSKAAGGRW